MEMIPRLILRKDERPPFSFILLTGDSYMDYYLFTEDELEEAMAQLKAEYAKDNTIAYLGIPKFCNHDRTYRVKEFMKLDCYGKVYFEEFGETHLHIAFHTNHGLWLNERDDIKGQENG